MMAVRFSRLAISPETRVHCLVCEQLLWDPHTRAADGYLTTFVVYVANEQLGTTCPKCAAQFDVASEACRSTPSG